MKFFPFKLGVIILIWISIGCNSRTDNQQWQQIAKADSLMFINPDSSLRIISRLNDIEGNDASTQAYYHLIATKAKSRNGLLTDQDSMIFQSVDYYNNNRSNLKKLIWSLIYASKVKSKAGNDSLALKYIREAASIAETHKISDGRLNTFIYNYWGDILYGKRPFHDAIDKYLIAERFARSLNDTSRVISNFIDIGSLYLLNHEYDAGRNYLERAINFISVYPKKANSIPYIYERIGTSYYMEGDNEKALSWITKAINSTTGHDYPVLWNLYLSKAEILTESGKLDSVSYYLNAAESCKRDQSYSNQALFELTRSKYEAGRGDYKKAFETHRKYSAMLDSMYIEDQRNRVAEFQRRYDYQDVAMERDRIKIESQAKSIRWLWAVLGFLTIALTALVYAYVQRRRRINVEISRDKSINSAVADVEGRLRQELMQRDRHIGALRDRVIMMDSTLEKIRRLRDASQKERATESGKFSMTDSELEHLLATVNICHEGFIDGLREEYPTIADKDVEICALIKLGLQNRDIGLLLGMSDNTLKTRKKRLKKEKLSDELSNMTLEEWILSKNYEITVDEE